MQNRAGIFKPQLSGAAQYRSFVPVPLSRIALGAPGSGFAALLARTHHHLGALDLLSSRIPDVALFISQYIRKEALLSSQIEGTQATLEDILEPAVEENRNLNVAEVVNYIRALNYALERRRQLPLCNRLLREIHGILLAGIRGGDKNPGEFRRSQNWLGPAGSRINTARYVPPSPEDMIPALDELERYIHASRSGSSQRDPLVRAALIHYQFETIHPFLDGNGRIGRLLIILYLMERRILSQPVLYISYFFKQNRQEYYERLNRVRERGDYEQWVDFFVRAVHDTAVDAVETIDVLMALRERNAAKIETLGRSAKTARRLYSYLERSPIMDIGKTAAALGLSFNTVAKAVENLSALGIVRQADAQGQRPARNRTFVYGEYVEILRRGT
jgi:Fic family protein